MNTTGKLIIFSAPSGSGKTTIVHALMERGLPLEFSISACNRAPRKGEVDGKDYYFMTEEEFSSAVSRDEFVEWEEVYEGRFYGTLKSELDRIWNMGKHVVFDVDVAGGLELKRLFGDRALAVFVQPPSVEVLRLRLETRNTDSVEDIDKRVAKANTELSFAPQFDLRIVNDQLNTAITETVAAVEAFLAK